MDVGRRDLPGAGGEGSEVPPVRPGWRVTLTPVGPVSFEVLQWMLVRAVAAIGDAPVDVVVRVEQFDQGELR